MEENSRWKRCPCERSQAVLPFFMSHPVGGNEGWQAPWQWNFGSWDEEDAVIRDLEYMIQMYPGLAKKYQRKISKMLDTFDYQGSVIYDEYPDRLALSGMTDHIYDEVKKEEALEEDNQFIRELIQILLYYEIFRKRRSMYSGGAGSYGWMNGSRRWPQTNRWNTGNPWDMGNP